MSPSRNFVKFSHKLDLYKKVSLPNDMGQMNASWNLYQQNVKCLFYRSGNATAIRISPNVAETDFYTVYFNHDAPIDYGVRLKNVTTSVSGEQIFSGWLEITEINKHITFTGKIQYLEIKAKNVIE